MTVAESDDTLVTEVNVQIGARTLAPADFHYIDIWAQSSTMNESSEAASRDNIRIALKRSRAVLEAVQAARKANI